MRDLITHPPWRAVVSTQSSVVRARRSFFTAHIVVVALILSLSGPLCGTGVTADNRLELVLLHLTVAAVVLPLLYRGAAAREPDQGEPR
jgi:hypothetical protein